MERNVCGLDRIVRLALGTVLAALALSSVHDDGNRYRREPVGPWQILTAYAAGELLLTGALQWCPGNYVLGVNTCEQGWRGALRDVRRRFTEYRR